MNETIFCRDCKYLDSTCETKNRDESLPEFDWDLLELFQSQPFEAFDNEQYREPKIKAIPIKLPQQKIIPVISNKYKKENIVLFPFSSLSKKDSNFDIHRTFGENTKVGLLMTSKDIELIDFITDTAWHSRLKKRKFDFVCSPNISFYFNQPSCSTINNRLLTYKTIAELINNDIPTIPSLMFTWESDVLKYVDWLNKCKFEYVYFNTQMVKKDAVFNSMIERLEKYVLPNLNAKIILVGVFSIDRIAALEKISDKFIYASTYMSILSGLKVEWKNNKERKLGQFEELYFENIFEKNMKNYRQSLSKVTEVCYGW